jgi:hypothetical protein
MVGVGQQRRGGDALSPAWLTRPFVSISSAHEDAEPARAVQRRLEDAGFRVRIDEGALRAGDSLIAFDRHRDPQD